MEARDIIAEVGRAQHDLASLRLDPNVTPEGLARCQSTVWDLETITTAILKEAWIPRTLPEITACVYGVRENMRCVQEQIDQRIDGVIDRGQPDELFRVWMAMTFGRLLGFQFDVLMAALADATPETKWLN